MGIWEDGIVFGLAKVNAFIGYTKLVQSNDGPILETRTKNLTRATEQPIGRTFTQS